MSDDTFTNGSDSSVGSHWRVTWDEAGPFPTNPFSAIPSSATPLEPITPPSIALRGLLQARETEYRKAKEIAEEYLKKYAGDDSGMMMHFMEYCDSKIAEFRNRRGE